MDDTMQTIQLLELELPDFDQYFQEQNLGQPLTTFHCFQELPAEIRYDIWQAMFPGRRMIYLAQAESRCTKENKHLDPALPISLHINRESRRITLEHYKFVFEVYPLYSDWDFMIFNKEKKTNYRPVCFNPAVDLVCAHFTELWGNHSELKKIDATNPDFFDAIRSLEVRGTEWSIYGPREDVFEECLEADFAALRCFRGLRELHFILGKALQRTDAAELVVQMEKALKILRDWYQDDRFDVPGMKRSVPQIFFHHYRRKESWSDEDNRNFKRIIVTDASVE